MCSEVSGAAGGGGCGVGVVAALALRREVLSLCLYSHAQDCRWKWLAYARLVLARDLDGCDQASLALSWPRWPIHKHVHVTALNGASLRIPSSGSVDLTAPWPKVPCRTSDRTAQSVAYRCREHKVCYLNVSAIGFPPGCVRPIQVFPGTRWKGDSSTVEGRRSPPHHVQRTVP